MRALSLVFGSVLAILLGPGLPSVAAGECPPDGGPASQLGPGAPGAVLQQTPWLEEPAVYQENCDGTFENGYCWRRDGVIDPYYGAFAERYHGPAGVVGIRVYLTTIYEPPYYRTSDLYIWGAGVSGPGAVLAMSPGIEFTAIPMWPDVGGFDFAISADVGPNFYVGSRANFGPEPGPCDYFTAADCGGPGGSPWTFIAPGMGYPTGWQDPGLVFGETHAMGYGVYTAAEQGIEDPPLDGGLDPRTTWGQVKTLFGR